MELVEVERETNMVEELVAALKMTMEQLVTVSAKTRIEKLESISRGEGISVQNAMDGRAAYADDCAAHIASMKGKWEAHAHGAVVSAKSVPVRRVHGRSPHRHTNGRGDAVKRQQLKKGILTAPRVMLPHILACLHEHRTQKIETPLSTIRAWVEKGVKLNDSDKSKYEGNQVPRWHMSISAQMNGLMKKGWVKKCAEKAHWTLTPIGARESRKLLRERVDAQ